MRTQHSPVTLSKTWIFRFSSLAFISLGTPALGVTFHGAIGFFLFLGLALIAGILQNKVSLVLNSIALGISKNKLLFYFSLCYFVGFTASILVTGGGLGNWRLFIPSLTILFALFYAFGFMQDDFCQRYFQIAYMIILGINYAYAIPVMIHNPNIARQMWADTRGVWIYGNQSFYAIDAIILPVLFWRSLKERGLGRIVLLSSSICIFIVCYISSFATPVGLIALSIPIIILLSLFYSKSITKLITSILIAGVLLISGYLIYRNTSHNVLLADSFTRITNFINDPQSGGYNQNKFYLSRWYLDQISFQSFQSAPILGIGGDPSINNPWIGGHSSFFDSLATLGLLGGGGALCAIIIVILTNAIRRFYKERNWESIVALTTVLLLIIAGVVNPYWPGSLPMVLIIAHPFYFRRQFITAASIENTPAGINPSGLI